VFHTPDPAAEGVAATEADVQLFWGEPLDGVAERIERLKVLSEKLGREHSPLECGLRVTTVVRDTTEQAWADAEARVAETPGRTTPAAAA
jgi:alkanesulfonate monooxygenase